MRYKNRVSQYTAGASGDFNQFVGMNPEDNYMGAAGNAQVLNPNDRTLTVTVVNASVSAITNVMIFGTVKDLTDANKNAAVTITVAESSHLQVKTELLQNPFRILGLKYVVTTVAQFNNSLTLVEEKSTGSLHSVKWQPLNFRSAQNQITTQIDCASFEFLVTSNTYFTFTIAASETVTFTFTLVERFDAKAELRDGRTRQVSRTMAPTGLPQLDLQRGL